MSWEHVLLEKSERIGTITLNRPEKLNALGGRMRDEIFEAAMDYEAYALGITSKSDDFKEGFKAFLEKREPEFKGR